MNKELSHLLKTRFVEISNRCDLSFCNRSLTFLKNFRSSMVERNMNVCFDCELGYVWIMLVV